MFQHLYELARCLPPHAPWEQLNEGLPETYNRGLALCFGADGEWLGVRTHYGNQGVVYRSGPSNGTDLTPCCKLATDTANRLGRAIEDSLKAPELSAEQRQWLELSLATFRAKQQAIWSEVETACRQAGVDGKGQRAYVYWVEAQGQPVYAWPQVQDILVRKATEKWAEGGKRQGICAVCGQAGTVYGNYAVLACYNLDKPGSIAGGFQRELAHRNFPVCTNCAFKLAQAIAFAERHLASQMAGQAYLALPYSNSEKIRAELYQRLQRDPNRYQLGRLHDLVADEWALLDEFGDAGDQLALTLIFYQQDNAAWRLQAEVQQVLPSRLHALKKAGRAIARASDLQVEKDGAVHAVEINAQVFKDFAGGSEQASAETLRVWLTALFAGQAIDPDHFLRCLVSRLLEAGRGSPALLPWLTRRAWGLWRYARLVELIPAPFQEENPKMSEIIPNSPYGRYVRAHQDFFRRPELVVAFLTGCYAATVTGVQYQERGNDPFSKKFIGRLLDRQQLRRIYTEGHAKLAQYDKLGYVITGLDPDLAQAWVACGETWAISDEEATFAFTLGFSLKARIDQLERASSQAEPLAESA